MILIHIANMFSSTILSIIAAGENTHLPPHKLDIIIILKSLVIQWLKKNHLNFHFVLVRVILFYIYSVGLFFFLPCLVGSQFLTRDRTPLQIKAQVLDYWGIPFVGHILTNVIINLKKNCGNFYLDAFSTLCGDILFLTWDSTGKPLCFALAAWLSIFRVQNLTASTVLM